MQDRSRTMGSVENAETSDCRHAGRTLAWSAKRCRARVADTAGQLWSCPMRPAVRSTPSGGSWRRGMSELLGQQIIVENMGGAGGMTGAARVAKATPDGYTLLLSGSAVLAINQTLYKRPLYNAVTEFRAGRAVFGFGARADRAAELSRATRSPISSPTRKPTRARCSTARPAPDPGTHVCAVLLDVAMGTKITHVPYRGAGPAMQDLIAGRIDFIAEQISTAMPQIQGKTVKAIATLGLDRAPGLEDLPDRGGTRTEGARLRLLELVLVSQGYARMPSSAASPRRRTMRWRRRRCATGSRASA